MRRLLERGVYFTLTVITSTKQIRRVVCSRSKIEKKKFVSRRLILSTLMQSLEMSFIL